LAAPTSELGQLDATLAASPAEAAASALSRLALADTGAMLWTSGRELMRGEIGRNVLDARAAQKVALQDNASPVYNSPSDKRIYVTVVYHKHCRSLAPMPGAIAARRRKSSLGRTLTGR
jgi:hypothetical protein